MQLNREPKYCSDVGIRTIPPEKTLQRAIPLLEKAGMVDLEDISKTDTIGIPVWSVSWPGAPQGAVSNFNGKGPTREQAMASAVMEAMERYSAKMRPEDCLEVATIDEIAERGPYIDPRELILPTRVLSYLVDQPIAWTKGYDLFRGEEIWVPANAVFHPYSPHGDLQLFRYNTNGIASGNTIEEAILHALLELIERDAWSLADFHRRVNADVIVDDPDSVCAKLIHQCEEAGVEIHLKDLTTDVGIPTIGAAADDIRTKDPEMLVIGVGTHLNPEIAAVRAITEAAQSRTTHRHGIKVDPHRRAMCQELGYERMKKINSMWFSTTGREVRLSEMERLDTPYVLDDIEVVFQRLIDAGFYMAVTVDLTREDICIPVVRMIVPGMEVYTMDPEREGPRLHGQWPLV
ncbi:MAG: thioglycine synthase [Candidatus Methanomethylophilaceae archaeon]|nr:thioglycine synthase [Candidatus Methanomethylophilaceae archaeon]